MPLICTEKRDVYQNVTPGIFCRVIYRVFSSDQSLHSEAVRQLPVNSYLLLVLGPRLGNQFIAVILVTSNVGLSLNLATSCQKINVVDCGDATRIVML